MPVFDQSDPMAIGSLGSNILTPSSIASMIWTLADLKTAAWLVENGHLTQLEMPTLAPDLETASVSKELEIIRRVASVVLSNSDKENLTKKQGQKFVYSRSFQES